jgi:hypothetical protein
MPTQQESLTALKRLVTASECFVGGSYPDLSDFWETWAHRNTEEKFELALGDARALLRRRLT